MFHRREPRDRRSSNVRLAAVASDPLGKAGRAIIEALLKGEQTPEQITETAGRRLRASKADIARAIDGVLSDTTRFLLRQMLAHIDQVDATLAQLDARIAELLVPMGEACALVTAKRARRWLPGRREGIGGPDAYRQQMVVTSLCVNVTAPTDVALPPEAQEPPVDVTTTSMVAQVEPRFRQVPLLLSAMALVQFPFGDTLTPHEAPVGVPHVQPGEFVQARVSLHAV